MATQERTGAGTAGSNLPEMRQATPMLPAGNSWSGSITREGGHMVKLVYIVRAREGMALEEF